MQRFVKLERLGLIQVSGARVLTVDMNAETSTAWEIVPTAAPEMSDEDLAFQLQLEEDCAYQQQLLALSQGPEFLSSMFGRSSPSSTPSPASSSRRRRRVGNVGQYPERLANRSSGAFTSEPRPRWNEIAALGSAPRLTSRFFPPLNADRDHSPSPIRKGISGDRERLMNCDICTETRPYTLFISTSGCNHKYCSDCCKHRAEVKVSSGNTQIECPHPDCRHGFDIKQCTELLSQVSFDILTTRQTEAAIPSSQKVYCPFRDCSALMENSETSSHSDGGNFAECGACHRGFCLSCSTAWHSNKTCAEHRADVQNAEQSGDEKLRELANKKKWQVCSECQRMIELNEGCYHMTCLCGNEFCYTCGAKWKNKAASCACKLWDENNIIRSRAGRRFFGDAQWLG